MDAFKKYLRENSSRHDVSDYFQKFCDELKLTILVLSSRIIFICILSAFFNGFYQACIQKARCKLTLFIFIDRWDGPVNCATLWYQERGPF